MKCALTLVFSVLLLLPGVTAQQSPTNDAKNSGDAQASTSSETWTDPESGLMWPRKDAGSHMQWKKAQKYCADLRLGGQSDWRLPKETLNKYSISTDLQARVRRNLAEGL